MRKWIETNREIVQPWHCDVVGHLNTANYIQFFDVASWHFFLKFGFSPASSDRDKKGWADVRHPIEYRKELRAGDLILIRSCVTALGNKSVTCCHELINAETSELHASLDAVAVYFDKEARKAIPLPDNFRQQASLLLHE